MVGGGIIKTISEFMFGLLMVSPMEQYEIYPLITLIGISNVIFYLAVAASLSILITRIGIISELGLAIVNMNEY